MFGIADFLWRLIPANPILLRVVQIGGKRRRDLFVRCGYLGILVVLVLILLAQQSSDVGGDLDKLTDISRTIFKQMSYGQLLLVALLAPMFTAGAITQEKDSQTYDILLSTPLTNGQIVLGSLLSRLFFIVALLVSGIPIFSITQIFGGVAIGSIALSFAIAAATAFITGALAMAIATFKVGTRRTIFSFYLFIVVYLVALLLLDRLDYFHPIKANGARALTSWFTGLHPFLALRVIFNDKDYLAPAMAELPPHLQSWPIGWYLSSPHTFFIGFMFFLSLLIVLPSIVLLRRVAQSTLSLRTWLLQVLHVSRGDRTRKPRAVWHNPIAWREARTKASAARAYVLRYGFMGAGTIAAFILVIMFSSLQQPASFIDRNSIDAVQHTISVITGDHATTYSFNPNTTPVTLNGGESSFETLQSGKYAVSITTNNRSTLTSLTATDIPRCLAAADARKFLLGALIIEVAVILLIVTNAAASTVTREKEDGTLDLLLSTPITSHYYIWGKLRGLVSFVLPLIAVPVASVLLFVIYDLFRLFAGSEASFRWVVLPEAVLILPAMLIIMAALAAIVGMHMSLRCRTTVMAVMSSVGIVVGVTGALGGCGYSLLGHGGGGLPGLAVSSFSPLTVLTVLVDPYTFTSGIFDAADPSQVVMARCLVFFFSLAATAAYAAGVWAMYRSMVHNFDMTIRRQSR